MRPVLPPLPPLCSPLFGHFILSYVTLCHECRWRRCTQELCVTRCRLSTCSDHLVIVPHLIKVTSPHLTSPPSCFAVFLPKTLTSPTCLCVCQSVRIGELCMTHPKSRRQLYGLWTPLALRSVIPCHAFAALQTFSWTEFFPPVGIPSPTIIK